MKDETITTVEYMPPVTMEGIICGCMIGIIIFCIAGIVIMIMYKNKEIKLGISLIAIIIAIIISSIIAMMLFNKF